MVFLDAQALIALLLDEHAAGRIGRLLQTEECAMTAVNVAEVYDVCGRRARLPLDEIDAAILPLLDGPVRVLAVGIQLARRAGEIRTARYNRRSRRLSLSDCFLLAAPAAGEAIATADQRILEVARELGLRPISLR